MDLPVAFWQVYRQVHLFIYEESDNHSSVFYNGFH